MKDDTQRLARWKTGFQVGLVAVAVVLVAALGSLIKGIPADQRADGLIGLGAAVLVLSTGLTGIYRFARFIEKEDAELSRH